MKRHPVNVVGLESGQDVLQMNQMHIKGRKVELEAEK